jgi:DNA-binding PucR family transcriptional regulator
MPIILFLFLALLAFGGAVVVAELTKTDEERLSQLEPDTQTKVRALIDRMAQLGYKIKVGSTLRSLADQLAAFAAGKSSVKAGFHQLGRAADLYVYDSATGELDMNAKNESLYRTLHQNAADMGLHGLAYSPYPNGPKHYLSSGVWDAAHVENYGPYASLKEALEAEA